MERCASDPEVQSKKVQDSDPLYNGPDPQPLFNDMKGAISITSRNLRVTIYFCPY